MEFTAGRMARSIATDGRFVARLLHDLNDSNPRIRRCAISIVGQMGPSVTSRPNVLETLLKVLVADDDRRVQREAATALGDMGEEARRHPRVAPALIEKLQRSEEWNWEEEDREMRARAACALWRLGQAKEHPAMLPTLIGALCSSYEHEVLETAANAILEISRTSPRNPLIINSLDDWAEQLKDSRNGSWRLYLMSALSYVSEIAVHRRSVITGLLSCGYNDYGYDHEGKIRAAALGVLGEMGEQAAHRRGVLSRLVRTASSNFEEEEVRRSAAQSLGKMGQTAARRPAVLDSLFYWGREFRFHESFHESASVALGRLMAIGGMRRTGRSWNCSEWLHVDALSRCENPPDILRLVGRRNHRDR